MPPSIWARTTSGLMAVPQSTAQTTRSTFGRPSGRRETSATCATMVLERLVDGDPPRPAGGQRLTPARLLGRQIQDGQVAGMLGQERAPHLERIAAGRVRALVQERLGRERGVRAARPSATRAPARRPRWCGAPRRCWARRTEGRGALHGRGVDPVPHHGQRGRRALEDRLADDAVLPADDVALRVEPGAQAVHVERAIPAALDVVLARPHELHGLVAPDGLGDGGRLPDDLAVRGGAAAETAARQHGVDAHLGREHAQRQRRPPACRSWGAASRSRRRSRRGPRGSRASSGSMGACAR